jgi:hypothetical protein
VAREQEGAASRKMPAFQEAPGEAEADASRDRFLQTVGSNPPSELLEAVDGGTRARVVSRLQQERGNAFVQRVLGTGRGDPGRLVGLSQPEMVAEVQRRKGAGAQLPKAAQAPLEAHFGAPLDGVRVHTDDEAATLSRELDASAFTVGSDVFFAEGQYVPQSTEGQALLAHEITHVGQQMGFGGAVQREEGALSDEELKKKAEEEQS